MDPIATIRNNIPRLASPDTVAAAAAAIGKMQGAATVWCCTAAVQLLVHTIVAGRSSTA
jgi:hypothetical protein